MTNYSEKEIKSFLMYINPDDRDMAEGALSELLKNRDIRLIDMIMEIIRSEENIPNKLFVYRKNVWDVYKGRIGEKLQALKEQLK